MVACILIMDTRVPPVSEATKEADTMKTPEDAITSRNSAPRGVSNRLWEVNAWLLHISMFHNVGYSTGR